MAFPTTGVLDDCNRANTGPPPSSNWTTVNGAGHIVSSNQLANSAADHSDSAWNVSTYGPDCELYYDIATKPGTGKWCDVDVRVGSLVAGWSGYQVELTNNSGTDAIDIYRNDAGSFTLLGSQILQEFSAGDGLGVEMVGTTLTVYRRSGGTWSSLGTRTDATYGSAGYLMVGAGDTATARLDNVGGGTVVPASTSNRLLPLTGVGMGVRVLAASQLREPINRRQLGALLAMLLHPFKKFSAAWLLWCVLVPPLVYAAPSISGVSGTVTHGGSITITGSSFGSKGGTNANKPLIWADFETSINPSSLGHLTTWDETENLSRQTSAPQYGISAGNVIGTWSSGVRSFSFGVTHTMTKLYQSGKRRMSAAGTDNQKFFRIWNDASTDTVASTSNGGIILDELCVQAGRYQAVSLPGNAWEMHEFLWKQSTSNDGGLTTGNGYFEFLQNGSQEMYLDDLCTHTTANYGQGNKLRVIDTFTDSSHLQPDGTNVWLDDLYVDDTWARVIIGNASTLATSTTTREVQIPSAWSATSITVTVNRGAFGSSASAYLYVVDSTNAVNSTGYPITFGAGGGGGSTGGSMDVKYVPQLNGLARTVSGR